MYTATTDIIQVELQILYSKGFINKWQITYLMGNQPHRPCYCYLPPKIHTQMIRWTIPHHIPPGRPKCCQLPSKESSYWLS